MTSCLTDLWQELPGLKDVQQKIQQTLMWPLQHANAFKRLGLHMPHGLLLYGPPGDEAIN